MKPLTGLFWTIVFIKKKQKKRKSKKKVIPIKCFSLAQVQYIRDVTAKDRKKDLLAMRDWWLIELGLHTGMRVAEMIPLKHKDIVISGQSLPIVNVRDGKGCKDRMIYVEHNFKKIYYEFTAWQATHGQPTDPESYLFCNPEKQTHLSVRTLQYSCERSLTKAKLPDHFSHHTLRHTYAHWLNKASGDIDLVRRMLGHTSLAATQVYLSTLATEDELQAAISDIYNPQRYNRRITKQRYPIPDIKEFYESSAPTTVTT